MRNQLKPEHIVIISGPDSDTQGIKAYLILNKKACILLDLNVFPGKGLITDSSGLIAVGGAAEPPPPISDVTGRRLDR